MMSDRGYLAFDAPHILVDLVIVDNLAAGDESAVIVPEPVVGEANKVINTVEAIKAIESVVAICVDPGPADVGANVEASPVEHDWSCRRWSLQGHVSRLRGTPKHHSG